MTVVHIPDPALVVLVGAAGSGKSTFAARWFTDDEILSADALRAVIAGDAADQRATRPAFAALHRAVTRRLASGLTTVVDATNVERHARQALLTRAAATGVPAVAIVLDLPAADVRARNAARTERVVPAEVVDHHIERLRLVVVPGILEAEGFRSVTIVRSAAELDRIELDRVSVTPSQPR